MILNIDAIVELCDTVAGSMEDAFRAVTPNIGADKTADTVGELGVDAASSRFRPFRDTCE